MRRIPRVDVWMTRGPQSIEAPEGLDRAEELMGKGGIRHLAVTEHGELIGVISDRDVKMALASLRAREEELTVAEICRTDPYVVSVDDPLDAVAEGMARRHIGSALVVENGRLVGIFTGTDACRCLAETLREED